jgi:hypothetical protein
MPLLAAASTFEQNHKDRPAMADLQVNIHTKENERR